jgi:APA family basic amino acid/polyamine antiporter
MIKPQESVQLPRVLGLTSGIMLVAGIMIGSGIFKKIVPMAASGLSAELIIAAWVVAGIVTMLGALTVSSLAGLTTESGGEYEYLRLIFGNFTAFLFGWSSFTIIGSASIAAMGFILVQSLNAIVSIPDPLHHLKDINLGEIIYPFADSGIKLIAVVFIILLTWINCRGARKGAGLNNVLTYAKITGIVLIIVAGLSLGTTTNATQSTIHINNTGQGIGSLFFAAMLSAFWAYDGWLNVSFVTGEIRNPRQNVPRAIITGVGLVMILYILVNAAYLKTLPLQSLATMSENKIAASEMISAVMGNRWIVVINLLIFLSVLGSLNGIILTYARLYFKMANDQLFFPSLGKIHPQLMTPQNALLASMLVSCVLVFSGTFDMLTDMIIFAGFLFYALLAIGLIKLYRQRKIVQKPWGYPLVPVLFILFSVLLLINTVITQPKQTLMGIMMLLLGIPFYYYFRRRSTKTQAK